MITYIFIYCFFCGSPKMYFSVFVSSCAPFLFFAIGWNNFSSQIQYFSISTIKENNFIAYQIFPQSRQTQTFFDVKVEDLKKFSVQRTYVYIYYMVHLGFVSNKEVVKQFV
eukprot:TRINITY_DN4224_c0_g1_i12.p9 TRINITY_DN4224_c0_g1~~TRINITY_DN4224_c0_g1_i12.p9  ORF type:complete len:111 (-),score=0.21 TRINITY_DN4224_c0_g1_i12:1192-1524(-)